MQIKGSKYAILGTQQKALKTQAHWSALWVRLSVLERTVSAIDRTHTDLAAPNSSFFIIYITFSFVTLHRRHRLELKFDLLSFLCLFFNSFVSFVIFMLSIDFMMSFVNMRG